MDSVRPSAIGPAMRRPFPAKSPRRRWRILSAMRLSKPTGAATRSINAARSWTHGRPIVTQNPRAMSFELRAAFAMDDEHPRFLSLEQAYQRQATVEGLTRGEFLDKLHSYLSKGRLAATELRDGKRVAIPREAWSHYKPVFD